MRFMRDPFRMLGMEVLQTIRSYTLADGGKQKNRRGRTPKGIPPRRFTRQRASRYGRVALHLVIRRLLIHSCAEPPSNSLRRLLTTRIVRLGTGKTRGQSGIHDGALEIGRKQARDPVA
jgi:hypothetical protein